MAALCLSSMLLFGFRACAVKHLGQNGDTKNHLVTLYNSLSKSQKRILLNVLKKYSEADQKKLASLFGELSDQEIASLKGVLNKFSDGAQTADAAAMIASMIQVLLNNDYDADGLKTLIKDLVDENYESQAAQTFLSKLTEEMPQDANPLADDSPEAGPDLSKVPEASEWEQHLKYLPLGEDQRKSLLATALSLTKEASAALYSLLNNSVEDWKQRFLHIIADFQEDARKNVLDAILELQRRNATIMKKICQGQPLGIVDKARFARLVGGLNREQQSLMCSLWKKL